jgi:DNA-directed RNA polymerase subunit beta'
MLRNTDGNLIAMGRSMAIQILTIRAHERSSQRVTYGSQDLWSKRATRFKRGQRMAEWDPYTRPILADVDGTVEFEDLVDGVSMSEPGRRGHRYHQASDHRLALDPARRRSASPAMVIKDKKGEIAQDWPRGGDARAFQLLGRG